MEEDYGRQNCVKDLIELGYDMSKTEITCDECLVNKICEFRWDPYNTNGDCLAIK